MDFEVFTEKMMELLKERLGEGYEIGVHEELKNNGIRKTGIGVKKEGAHFGSVLYLEDAYRKYREGMDAEEVLDELLDVYKSACDQDPCEKFQPEAFGDYSQVKERLRFRLVNYEMNMEMLADVPYIRWNDLAVIFCYEVDTWEGSNVSITIRNQHLAMWGRMAGTLYEDALRNMKNGYRMKCFRWTICFL